MNARPRITGREEMARRRTSARGAYPSRASREANWAFRADDDAVLDALVSGRHAAACASTSARRRMHNCPCSPRREAGPAAERTQVLILPGIMGSKLGGGGRRGNSGVLWMDPLQISRASGRADIARRTGAARGRVLLFSYARLKLQLRIDGRDAHFHFYDWRLGLDEVGAQLASRIAAEGAR